MPVPCTIVRLGLVDYMEAWELQNRLADEVKRGQSEGWLLLVEHPHTYTFGRGGDPQNLLLNEEQLNEIDARVYWVDRGGDVTYHGPGQLVGYPIVDLHKWGEGPRWFVRSLEAALIDALATMGISAERSEGRPGVWAGNEKLAAIGLHISHGVSTHGFALNVDPDLSYFEHIVSCGLADAGVTSISEKLGRPVSIDEAADALEDALVRHLSLSPRMAEADDMLIRLSPR